MVGNATLHYVGKRLAIKKIIGAELVKIMIEKVKVIRDRMKAAQDRQKSYADTRRRLLEFVVGDWVSLKVAPYKHMFCFGMKGKLTSEYIGPFEVIERIGIVAYKLVLPSHLAKIHIVFHVSMLRKAEIDLSRVLLQVPMEIKILWRSSQIEEETWERESEMRRKYPELFQDPNMT
jgi:hypothetical protein